MKKIKIYGVDSWIPESKQEQESLNALAEVQGASIWLHYGEILKGKTAKLSTLTEKTPHV